MTSLFQQATSDSLTHPVPTGAVSGRVTLCRLPPRPPQASPVSFHFWHSCWDVVISHPLTSPLSCPRFTEMASRLRVHSGRTEIQWIALQVLLETMSTSSLENPLSSLQAPFKVISPPRDPSKSLQSACCPTCLFSPTWHGELLVPNFVYSPLAH